MRNLRFRLIRDNKIVGYERSVYYQGRALMGIADTLFWEVSKDGKTDWVIVLSYTYICHDAKEQYVREEDCNSEDICEGDIVKVSTDGEGHIGEVEEIGQVVFFDGAFVIKTGDDFWTIDCIYSDEVTVEIIGNVHENSNLL